MPLSDIPTASNAESNASFETIKNLRSKKVQRRVDPREDGELSSEEEPIVLESTRKSLGISTESEQMRTTISQQSIENLKNQQNAFIEDASKSITMLSKKIDKLSSSMKQANDERSQMMKLIISLNEKSSSSEPGAATGLLRIILHELVIIFKE